MAKTDEQNISLKSQKAKGKMQNFNSKFKSDLIDRCFKLSLKVIKLSESIIPKPAVRIIIGQLIRSITSIGANLVEAKAASSRLEFKKYHEMSLKSANESKYWLMLLRESNLADKQIIDELLNELDEIAKMIASGVLKLKG